MGGIGRGEEAGKQEFVSKEKDYNFPREMPKESQTDKKCYCNTGCESLNRNPTLPLCDLLKPRVARRASSHALATVSDRLAY